MILSSEAHSPGVSSVFDLSAAYQNVKQTEPARGKMAGRPGRGETAQGGKEFLIPGGYGDAEQLQDLALIKPTQLDRPKDEETHRLARRIYVTSVANGIAAIVVIIGMAFWMADRVDRLAAITTNALFQSALQAELDSIEISTADYSYWDHAYDLVVTRNEVQLYADIGSGATEGETFDFIYLLDSDGSPLYAYETDGDTSDLTLVHPELVEAFFPRVIDLQLTPHTTISGYATYGQQLAVVAAGRIQTNDIDGRGERDFPVMIGGMWLSAERLAGIGEQLLISDVILHSTGDGHTHDKIDLEITGINGALIGHIGWRAPQSGRQLLASALPVILALSVLTFLTAVFVGRASAQQASAFLHQRKIARTDPLTGLTNRAGLDDLVASDMISQAITAGKIAVVYLDLNGFKQLNDNFGHDAGDLALQIIAERVRGAVRAEDYVIRLGGDEFACILIDDAPCQTAEQVAGRIIAATEPPVRIGDDTHTLRPAIGVALGTAAMGWTELLKNADRAMYRAKSSRTFEPVFYADSMKSTGSRSAA